MGLRPPRIGLCNGAPSFREGSLMDTKTVTIFGGSGFVGRNAVRALAKAGWRIRVASRRPNMAFFLKPLGTVGQIAFVKCDITDPDSVAAAVRGSDAVVNLVGIAYGNF